MESIPENVKQRYRYWGERPCRYDMIVTFRNGHDAARHGGGTLVPVAGFHNWPMAHPHRAAETILAALGQRTGSTAA